MRNAKMVVCLGAFAACVGAPGLSVAEDNCSGHYVDVGSKHFSMSNDPSSPDAASIGDCDAASFSTANSTWIGRCTMQDKDGHLYTYEWTRRAGAEKGTWKHVSGTGKYVDSKWSGWFQETRTQGTDVRVGLWGGNCK
jgi:hypothetical protein